MEIVGPPIQPERSVLLGCGFAIPFLRNYLRIDMQSLVDQLRIISWQDTRDIAGFPYAVTSSAHVDDVPQQAVGKLHDIIMLTVCAAELFLH